MPAMCEPGVARRGRATQGGPCRAGVPHVDDVAPKGSTRLGGAASSGDKPREHRAEPVRMRGLIPLRSKPARPGSLLGDRIERNAALRPAPGTRRWSGSCGSQPWPGSARLSSPGPPSRCPARRATFRGRAIRTASGHRLFRRGGCGRRERSLAHQRLGGVIWLLAVTSGLTLAVLTPQLVPVSTPLLLFRRAGDADLLPSLLARRA